MKCKETVSLYGDYLSTFLSLQEHKKFLSLQFKLQNAHNFIKIRVILYRAFHNFLRDYKHL